MRIDKDHKIELCASHDECRPHLLHPQLDVENKRLMATDGHRLVILPVELDDGDVSGPVSREAIKAARKGPLAKSKAGGVIAINANGSLAIEQGPTFPRPDNESFPPVDKVVPNGKNHTVVVGLNARYLWEIAQALGTVNVRIEIAPAEAGKPMLDPIVVTTNGDRDAGVGVLMPVRV